jgi:TatD DNase family protein
VLNITDSHTHLDSKEFDLDRAEVIARAHSAGVTRLLTIGASQGLESAVRAIALAEQYPFIWATVGVHPHDAGDDFDRARLLDLARHPRVVAVGETGLDFFRDWAPVDKQYEAFRTQIEVAHEVQKPLVIHSRNAGAECLRVLREGEAGLVGGVFHCFAEDAAFAAQLRELNFLVSFPGPLTFKKADATREICRAIPLDQILVETDAPFMAPEPYRGKRCESAFVLETVKALASVKGLTLQEVADATTANTLRLFKGMQK